jgi:EAL domain-containing protein (putative c-di-GMP-specific phosphodiesterase class I)
VDGWKLRDCRSTNGTFANGRRLTENHLLNHGDYITIGEIRFDVVEQIDDSECTLIINPDAENLERMLDLKAVIPHFQPLISLSDGALIGYEVLGRITYVGLPNNPAQLFQISRMLGRQIELSELFRNTALEYAAKIGVKELILFNTLPEEMNLECLGRSLKKLRQSVPDLKLGMELHENTITDVDMMKKLRSMLNELDMLLVYDDFGAGQSRLIELLDSVPDIVKFDMALIQNIQQRSETSRSIVETLVKMARDAGIRTLAEGVDSREEAETCKAIGFELAQGYYFGRPAPL